MISKNVNEWMVDKIVIFPFAPLTFCNPVKKNSCTISDHQSGQIIYPHGLFNLQLQRRKNTKTFCKHIRNRK